MSRSRGVVYRSLRWQRAPGKAPLRRPASRPPTNRRPISTCRSCMAAHPPDISFAHAHVYLSSTSAVAPHHRSDDNTAPGEAIGQRTNSGKQRHTLSLSPSPSGRARRSGAASRELPTRRRQIHAGQRGRQEGGRLRPAQPALPPDTQVSHRSCGARVPQRLNSFAATIRPCKLLCPCGTVNVCGLLFASRGGLVLDSTSGHRRS